MKGFTNIPIHQNIHQIDVLKNKLNHRFFLVLTNTELVPPHCSVLCRHLWFSLNYTENKINIDAETFLKVLASKNKSAVFIELNVYPQLKDIEITFSKYMSIDFEHQITCISPIKEILNTCGITIPVNALLYEMIEVLKNMNRIEKAYFFNSNEKEYVLLHYSPDHLKTIKL